jgi:hypothetical protein
MTLLELGTYHCPTSQPPYCVVSGGTLRNNDWYAYYMDPDGNYQVLHRQTASPGPDHTFYLYWYWPGGTAPDIWVWAVDATTIFTKPVSYFNPYGGAHWGDEADAGLERFGSSATNLGAFNSSNLHITDTGSGWIPWSGQDGTSAASNMCAVFLNDTRVRAGQPSSSC